MGERIAIFAPNPLLSITIEAAGASGDAVHIHAAGQGAWSARMVAELGGQPILCGFVGGETGETVRRLLEGLSGESRLISTAAATGCYVTDRRGEERTLLARALSPPASRHEVDDLIAAALTAALDCDVLLVANPFPADTVAPDVYAELVGDARANGVTVLADLSTPHLNSALKGHPDLVKVNDWELAEYVSGPVGDADELRDAAEDLLADGAGAVLVTRGGESALALRDGSAWEIVPPALPVGHREGCGDSMMGALAVAWARGMAWEQTLALGAGAGAANFLRQGLGTGHEDVVSRLAAQTAVHALCT